MRHIHALTFSEVNHAVDLKAEQMRSRTPTFQPRLNGNFVLIQEDKSHDFFKHKFFFPLEESQKEMHRSTKLFLQALEFGKKITHNKVHSSSVVNKVSSNTINLTRKLHSRVGSGLWVLDISNTFSSERPNSHSKVELGCCQDTLAVRRPHS